MKIRILTVALWLWAVLIMAVVCEKISQAEAPKAILLLRSSVVHLDRGTGSVVKGPSGSLYLLTNWHVCGVSQYKNKLFASYPNGEMISGYVVKKDPTKDLCAAYLKGVYPSLAVAPKLLPTDKVCTRGYPGHIPSESCGVIGKTAKWEAGFGIEEVGECPDKFKKDRDFEGRIKGCTYTYSSQLSTLYARPGSSGSPVVNSEGALVGVVSSWHQDSDYEAGLVTFKDLKEFMKDL